MLPDGGLTIDAMGGDARRYARSMAQTKRRRTKHRGNAAGMVEARGRTGRKLTPEEKKPIGGKGSARTNQRANRYENPPTWKAAVNRAAIAVVFFAVLIILIFKQPIANAIALAGVMLLLYVPMGYYTDLYMYRRYQRKLAEARK
jgi:hypothetical protein